MANIKNKLSYLNGFLEAIAQINSFENDGKTYYIKLLDKINDDIQATLRNHFEVKNWIIDYQLIDEDWKIIFERELLSYFNQINVEGSLYQSYNASTLLAFFIENIEDIIKTESKFYCIDINWRVNEGWYENYANDYVFDLENKILFLHFGSSD